MSREHDRTSMFYIGFRTLHRPTLLLQQLEKQNIYCPTLGKKFFCNFKVIGNFQRGDSSFRMSWQSLAIFSTGGICQPQVAGYTHFSMVSAFLLL